MKKDAKLDNLESELRTQAKNTPQEFSDQLHWRLMREVGATRVQSPMQQPYSTSRYFVIGGAAAMVVLGLMVWGYFARTTPAPRSAPQWAHANVTIVDDIFHKAATPIRDSFREAIPNSELAGLETDARSFSRFLARQIDQLPHGTSNPKSLAN